MKKETNFISKEKFLKWCEENKKDCKDKIVQLEYMAFVEGQEDVLKTYSKLKKGEIDLESIKLVGFNEDDTKCVEKNFLNLLIAICDYLGYAKKEELIKKFNKADSELKLVMIVSIEELMGCKLKATVETVYHSLELFEK